MTPTPIIDAINRIKIAALSLDFMVNEYLEVAGDFHLRTQFASEAMRAHAHKAAADVTIATTFAQIMAQRVDFNVVLDAVEFGETPNDAISDFKGFLLDRSLSVPGFAVDLPYAEVADRFAVMKRLLAH